MHVAGDLHTVQQVVAPGVTEGRIKQIEVFRITAAAGAPAVSVRSDTLSNVTTSCGLLSSRTTKSSGTS